MNSQFFDSRRFRMVVRHDWLLHRRQYLLTLTVLFTAYVLLCTTYHPEYPYSIEINWIFNISSKQTKMFHTQLHCLWVCFFFMLFQSNIFRRLMNHKNSCMEELTLPASPFEKFIYRWLMAVPISLLACIVMYYCALTVQTLILSLCTGHPLEPIDLWVQLSDWTYYRNLSGTNLFIVWCTLILFLQAASMSVNRRRMRWTYGLIMLVTLAGGCYLTNPGLYCKLFGVCSTTRPLLATTGGTVVWHVIFGALILILWYKTYRNYVNEELIFNSKSQENYDF